LFPFCSSTGLISIQRKVKFPFEFDVLDLVTDSLKQKLLPVNTRIKELEKERDERRKVRRRTRKAQAPVTTPAVDHVGTHSPASPTVEVGGATGPVGDGQMDVDTPAVVASAADDELGDEGEIRKREAEELAELVHPDLKADVGANVTGVYELVGAWLTLLS
jgi:ubiquitin carboxyl-terminal hydrolase 14